MILNLTRAEISQMRLWPALAALLLSFVWLQPHHYPPWQGFHEDAWTAIWMSFAGLLLVTFKLRQIQWSLSPIVAVALACVAWFQWFFGMVADVGQTLLFTSHLLAAALCWAIAKTYTAQEPYLVADVLFLAIGAACLGNTGIALYQWLQITPEYALEGAGIWLLSLPENARSTGNTAQPNEMATLLSWGIVAGLWAWTRQSVRWPVLLLYCLFLAIGLALSQSRIGILQISVLAICALVFRRLIGGWICGVILLLTLAIQVTFLLNAPEVLELLGLQQRARDVASMIHDTARLQIYELVLQAIKLSPWVGYGASHHAIPQWAVLDILPALHSFYMQSHNWGLDLLLWFGVPLGLLVITAVLAWAWFTFKAFRKTENKKDGSRVFVVSLALLVFTMHASVELPHWTANFLLTAAVFGGYICAATGRRVYCVSSRSASLTYIVIIATILCLCIYDYIRLERNFIQVRAEQLRVRTDISEVPDAFILSHLADNLRQSRIKPHPNMPPETMKWLLQGVKSNPTYLTMFQYSLALGLNGQHEDARLWMRRLNSVSPKAYAAHYARVWRIHQSEYPALIGSLRWPDS